MTSPTSRTPGPASPASGTPPLADKPLEAEELVDEYFHRPPARVLVRLLARTPVSPNQVTLLSGLVGVAAGTLVGLAAHRPELMLGAAILLYFSVVLDCCDGQLARIRGVSSTTGAVLDGLADYAVGIAMGIGGSYYMATVHQSPWFWLIGVAGLASSAFQSALFDHSKTRYIARVRVGYSEREENPEQVAADRARALREGRLWDGFLLFAYEQYSKAQNAAMAITPSNDPAGFRAANAGRMRAWTFLGIGTHFCFAYLCCLLAAFWAPGILLYFLICSIPFNLYLGLLMMLEPRAQTTA